MLAVVSGSWDTNTRPVRHKANQAEEQVVEMGRAVVSYK